jgi:hypothetical protein
VKIEWRYLVAAVLLLFAWKGSSLQIEWPPSPQVAVNTPKPEPALIAWAEPLRPILPKMLPSDRQYLSNFYDGLTYVLIRDSKRNHPILKTTADFEVFHGGSLEAAIDKEAVGRYPGLGEAIDQTFRNALGTDEVKPIEGDTRTRLTAASGVLSWVLGVGRDE